jgi:hypothetical protein
VVRTQNRENNPMQSRTDAVSRPSGH